MFRVTGTVPCPIAGTGSLSQSTARRAHVQVTGTGPSPSRRSLTPMSESPARAPVRVAGTGPWPTHWHRPLSESDSECRHPRCHQHRSAVTEAVAESSLFLSPSHYRSCQPVITVLVNQSSLFLSPTHRSSDHRATTALTRITEPCGHRALTVLVAELSLFLSPSHLFSAAAAEPSPVQSPGHH